MSRADRREGTLPDVEDIVRLLNLEPHPTEGGFFVETYRSADTLLPEAIGSGYDGPRAASTAIYYLVTPDSFSALHRVATDEVFHFYLGDPVEQLRLHPDGRGEIVRLGTDFAAGAVPQSVVPRGIWQGARLAPGGRYALMGATVAPGFDFADYEHGDREALSAAYPAFADRIKDLTP